MSFKAKSLNLYTPDGSEKLDIDVLADRVSVVTTNSTPVQVEPALKLAHSTGYIENVAEKILQVEQAVIDGDAGNSAGAAQVQANLDAYIATNDPRVSTLEQGLVSETAAREAGQTADAAARAALQVDYNDKITTEEQERQVADVAINERIDTLEASSNAGDALLQSSINAVQSEVAVERQRIDDLLAGSGVDLDTLVELVNSYSGADASVFRQVGDLTVRVSEIIQKLNVLTEGSDPTAIEELASVVAKLLLAQNKAFIQDDFSLRFNSKDILIAGQWAGEAGWRILVVAASGGVLDNNSTDEQVDQYYRDTQNIAFGADVIDNSDLTNTRLAYRETGQYLLETDLNGVGEVYFKGAVVAGETCDWRLTYLSVPNDESSKYSTILYGTQQDKVLTVHSVDGRFVEWPISGDFTNGDRIGQEVLVNQLVLK